MTKYRVNKETCLGIDNCGICMQACPGATKKGEDGKAEVVDNEKLEQCGGEAVCPMGSIEKADGEEESSSYQSTPDNKSDMGAGGGRGLGKGPQDGRGRGMNAGEGRGLGKGPQDGRGRGRGI